MVSTEKIYHHLQSENNNCSIEISPFELEENQNLQNKYNINLFSGLANQVNLVVEEKNIDLDDLLG